MIITEPITLLTDYAIALESMIFAILLFRLGYSRQQTAVQWWAVAFSFVALAAFLGGTCHGFVLYLGNQLSWELWQIMVYALSCASFFMLAATIIHTLPRRYHRWVLVAVALKSLIYLSWAGIQSYFGYVIADYISAMTIVLLLHSRAIWQDQQPSSWWIVAGVLVSTVAAVIQGGRWGLPGSLNYNDLYHLVQMIALYMFYRGARVIKVG